VSTTPGNPGNLLEFNWSSWKIDRIGFQSYGKIFVAKIRNLSPSDVFFQVLDAPKPVFGWGSAPDPCGGAYDAPPDRFLFGWGGDTES